MEFIIRSALACDGASVGHLNSLATRFYEGLGVGRIGDVVFMKRQADGI
jgi:hypothetical protein